MKILAVILLSVLLCGLGICLVRPRSTYSIDSLNYFAMTRGAWDEVGQPWRHRVVVPFVVGLLPVSAPRGFLLLAYSSLVGTYLLAFAICRKAGISFFASTLSVAAMLAARTHLYNYFNPFLTDAPGLFVATLLFFAYQIEMLPVFAVAAFIGVVIRESVAFIVPAWFLGKEWRIGLLIGCIALASLEGSTLLHPTNQPYAISFITSGAATWHNPLPMIEGVLLSWSALWILAFAGFVFMPREQWRAIAVPSTLLFVGALVSCFVSSDRERMLGIVYPVIVVLVAQAVETLWQIRTHLIPILAVLSLQLVLGNAYVLQSWPHHYLIGVVNAFSVITVTALTLINSRSSISRKSD
jgi:hypothetical protein